MPPVEQGHFREVKTGVLLRPSERVETSPGQHSLVRRFLATCLGDADAIFAGLYARLRELGWVGPRTVVVIVGDGAEWIWNRSQQADRWVRQIGEDPRAGQLQEVTARLGRLRPATEELRESLQALIHYYSDNAGRMRYDEYLAKGYGTRCRLCPSSASIGPAAGKLGCSGNAPRYAGFARTITHGLCSLSKKPSATRPTPLGATGGNSPPGTGRSRGIQLGPRP